MSDTTPQIDGYHAHIYYDPAATKQVAAELRAQIEERFEMIMGRWHDEQVGPHTVSMYQVAFENEVFAEIVPWLMVNRRGLSILVHPNTGDGYEDHKTHALWLGPQQRLNLEFLKRMQEKERAAAAQ
jgi:DOPA 4,5-dioxygenase